MTAVSKTSRIAAPTTDRRNIYYWKCDRQAAFYGVMREQPSDDADTIITGLHTILSEPFPGPREISPANGKGNHMTFSLKHAGKTYFVRVEDGPEGDTHLEIEADILKAVSKSGVPVPHVYYSDATRKKAPFAVQVVELIQYSDLKTLYDEGQLDLLNTARQIGEAIAKWQSVPVLGFGHFDTNDLPSKGTLQGYHETYADYFMLNLERHIGLLSDSGFIDKKTVDIVHSTITESTALLNASTGCLVHKDVALWNILGDSAGPKYYIDWDDAISGDPTDDLSLLACFYNSKVIQAAIDGYKGIRPLPDQFLPRFWLHLLRNMIVKAVIRVSAGYFEQTSFLTDTQNANGDLRAFTKERLLLACRGLNQNLPLSSL